MFVIQNTFIQSSNSATKFCCDFDWQPSLTPPDHFQFQLIKIIKVRLTPEIPCQVRSGIHRLAFELHES